MRKKEEERISNWLCLVLPYEDDVVQRQWLILFLWQQFYSQFHSDYIENNRQLYWNVSSMLPNKSNRNRIYIWHIWYDYILEKEREKINRISSRSMGSSPSFFWIEMEQFGHFLEFVTNHKQLAAISSSSSVPFTKRKWYWSCEQYLSLHSSGLISAVLSNQSFQFSHEAGSWPSCKQSQLEHHWKHVVSSLHLPTRNNVHYGS